MDLLRMQDFGEMARKYDFDDVVFLPGPGSYLSCFPLITLIRLLPPASSCVSFPLLPVGRLQ